MSGRHRQDRARGFRISRTALRLVASALLTGSGALLLAAPSNAVDNSSGGATGSEVTVHGTGRFSQVAVTVSQTRSLIDQVVRVSWSGATPTVPSVGSFDRDYMQIMQCWGDDPAGPRREQCQFGGLVGDSRGGAFVASRQVTYGDQLVDPVETYKQPAGSTDNVNVPFDAVNGDVIDGSSNINPYFDALSTNEIPFGRTRADGAGQEFFEIETSREAPGLGCGDPVTDPATGARTGRSCWLVVVPRDDTEVDGSVRTGGAHLDSSPLSASNWANRIVVPLTFQPIGIACPIGSAERRTVGQEAIAEAMTHWQPALCQQTGGTVFGYSSIGDDIARGQLSSPSPGLVFVSRPLSADQLPASGKPVYAPVGLEGLTIAFNIESRAGSTAPDAVKQQDGTRLTDLTLSPRLVAKLLTQSYQVAVPPGATDVSANPRDMTRDPDFLALNPAFQPLLFPGIADMLVPLGLSDAARELWDWVDADPDAHAFLQGQPDPWGMTVNPNYKGLTIPREDFPKSETYCDTDFPDNRPPLCTLDAHPYAADMHEAARAASRGDTLSRSVWDPTAVPPAWKKGPPQLSGTRAVVALTDTATAARYALPTAKLVNAAGNAVAPTDTSMLAAVSTMKPDPASGVLLPDPSAKAVDAYPLTMLTYAATVPDNLDSPARADLAAFLRYAAGAGQTPGLDPGQLPPGYVPLPNGMRQLTLAAADLIATPPTPTPTAAGASPVALAATPPVASPAAPVSKPSAAPQRPRDTQPSTAPAATPEQPVPAALPRMAPVPLRGSGSPAATTPRQPVLAPVVASALTPAQPIGPARLAVAVLLLVGGLGAGAGPALLRRAGQDGGDAPA